MIFLFNQPPGSLRNCKENIFLYYLSLEKATVLKRNYVFFLVANISLVLNRDKIDLFFFAFFSLRIHNINMLYKSHNFYLNVYVQCIISTMYLLTNIAST
ncbi:hypothetical protein HHI36_014667 [Cryptolaemus montrouzieri]|uniref:Uncharacterized protein n=1 Tax=Cryptolaemus montrouzieri TaxID=559131 RepID=A0ABD2N3C0_9CUCU